MNAICWQWFHQRQIPRGQKLLLKMTAGLCDLSVVYLWTVNRDETEWVSGIRLQLKSWYWFPTDAVSQTCQEGREKWNGLMELTEKLMNFQRNCITRVKGFETKAHFGSLLTAQWPVLWRHLSAAYNTRLLDPHCRKEQNGLFCCA